MITDRKFLLMPDLSPAALFLIHALACIMAFIDYLLNCFRRRKPISEQSRPLCTQEEAQITAPLDPQPVSPAKLGPDAERPVTPSADSVRIFARALPQQAISPELLELDQRDSLTLPEPETTSFPPQVMHNQLYIQYHSIASDQSNAL